MRRDIWLQVTESVQCRSDKTLHDPSTAYKKWMAQPTDLHFRQMVKVS